MTNLYTDFLNYIREKDLIHQGESVLAALSGGSDSVCLLLLLNNAKQEIGFELSAMYIDHMIRGEVSAKDGEFAKELCAKLNIPFYTEKKDVPGFVKKSGQSVEEAARNLRYEALRNKAHDISDNTLIAVAHNLNDQCETILFRMARGTGPKGMAGMRPKDKDIIRPILFAEKKKILDYLKSKNQSYRTDVTNEDVAYSRNRIRKNIIPELLELNSGALLHIAKLSEQLDEMTSDLELRAEEYVKKNISDLKSSYLLKTKNLETESNLFKTAVIREFVVSAKESLKDVTATHYEAIVALIDSETGKSLDLPGGTKVSKTYAGLLVKSDRSMDIPKGISGHINISVFPYEKGMMLPTKSYTKWFDYDKINGDVSLRTRGKGDVIVIHPTGQRKKLKDWFIDEKIPRDVRDELPVVAAGNDVLWIVGHRTSEGARIDECTKKILQIEFVQD